MKRATHILEALDRGDCSSADIADCIQMSQRTARRKLATLISHGLVATTEADGIRRYIITWAGRTALRSSDLVTLTGGPTVASPAHEQTVLAIAEGITTVTELAEEYGVSYEVARIRCFECVGLGLVERANGTGVGAAPGVHALTPAGREMVADLASRWRGAA